MIHNYTLRKMVVYFPQFIGFVYRKFPLAWLVLSLTLISACLEYVTFSLMIPLSGNVAASPAVGAFWLHVAKILGVSEYGLVWIWMFLALLLLRTSLTYILSWQSGLLSKQVHAFLSNNVFKRVMVDERLEAIYHRSIGYYVALAGDDTFRAGTIILNFGQLITSVLSAMVSLLLVYMFSHNIFYAVVVFILLSSISSAMLLRRIVAYNASSSTQSRELNTYFIEAINGIRSLRSMAVEQYIVDSYRNGIVNYVKTLLKIDLVNQGMKTGPALALLVVGIIWVWPGRNSLLQEHPLLYFIAITALITRALGALGAVVATSSVLISNIRAAHDINELVADETKVSPVAFQSFDKPIETISFADVACGYAKNTHVLTNVGGSFVAGRVYAIVGKSGSGKSTLADTILGLLPPQEGVVSINGVSLAQIHTGSLRKRVVLVEQQTRIFTGTIRDNILLGIAATDEQLNAAIDASGLAEFVVKLPEALAAKIEYQGSNISGGQRQRIGIARALIRKPEVLILDEATSALDWNTRDLVLQNIRGMMHNGILILITHDQEALAMADEVWHIKDGKSSIEVKAGNVK